MKNVPKITHIEKLRRFFVGSFSLKKKDKSLFKFYNLVSNKLMVSYIGFYALDSSVVYYNQLFALEKHLKKKLPKKIKVMINVPLVNAFTSKPSGIRMGKGKGMVKKYYGIVQQGNIFCEIYFTKPIEYYKYDLVYREIMTKLPFKFKLKFLNY